MSSLSATNRPALLDNTSRREHRFPGWPVFDATDEERVLRALRSGHWGKLSGTEVKTFEGRFAAMHGAKFGIGVVNGSISIRLALHAAGLRAEDEVIVPSYTFLASATAVVEANAVPVFADIDLETLNLCPKAFEAAITPRTRAVIVVHFAGLPANMEAILPIARKHGLVVIEDAAHAHCALYQGRPVGALGDAGSFSFQSSKNLNAGEGGIVITNNQSIAERVTSLHNCGRVSTGQWYEHHINAVNYRLGELQGALLNSQLNRLEQQTRLRDGNGIYLASRLASIPGVHTQLRDANCTRHAYHLFTFRIVAEEFGLSREMVLKALAAEGVGCGAGYPLPLYRQPLFLDKAFGPYLHRVAERLDFNKVRNPNCETICYEQGGWYTQSQLLGTRADMDAIADAWERIYEHRSALNDWAKRHLPT
ncbi:MAG: DegT/DnrJ/EryC1/StrS family aminotransferase [Opitutaceae bacterium]|nr:DegT/DnrJ/EryC1/StrS family aminotransferase [Opitutaceae bacterium]